MRAEQTDRPSLWPSSLLAVVAAREQGWPAVSHRGFKNAATFSALGTETSTPNDCIIVERGAIDQRKLGLPLSLRQSVILGEGRLYGFVNTTVGGRSRCCLRGARRVDIVTECYFWQTLGGHLASVCIGRFYPHWVICGKWLLAI